MDVRVRVEGELTGVVHIGDGEITGDRVLVYVGNSNIVRRKVKEQERREVTILI
jgi:hypothetical protein